jgi:hypothetical protein
MNKKKALQIISRYTPCAHSSYDDSLGSGTTYAKCYDCEETFLIERNEERSKALKEFDDAIDYLLNLEEPKLNTLPEFKMKTTTLRQLIKEDVDKAFQLKLYYFCNYNHDANLLTTEEFVNKFGPTKGYYGPYRCGGIYKEYLDLPLYLGE